ncbi:MAG: hypothetical protein ACOX75_06705 [Lachnospiraceae bacterium]|jgi:hypothetical protein
MAFVENKILNIEEAPIYDEFNFDSSREKLNQKIMIGDLDVEIVAVSAYIYCWY